MNEISCLYKHFTHRDRHAVHTCSNMDNSLPKCSQNMLVKVCSNYTWIISGSRVGVVINEQRDNLVTVIWGDLGIYLYPTK